jgi:hypothetical protein
MDPTVKDLALANEASYGEEAPVDYSRLNELSSPDISVYKHNVNPHTIISHRGTDIGATKATKQIKADVAILFGNKSHDKLHKDRVKQTEMIVTKLKETNPEHKIFLTGHSLGGSTAHHAMAKSEIVRKNVDQLHTFNAGTSPLQSKEISKKNKAYKVIAEKSIHHAVEGDAISSSIQSNLIGKHITYKAPKEKASVGRTILRLAKPHLEKSPLGRLVHFGAEKLLDTLSSHSLSNFTK